MPALALDLLEPSVAYSRKNSTYIALDKHFSGIPIERKCVAR